MGLLRVNVALCVSLMLLVLDKCADSTTHPRVKMYGPKVTVIDRRKPEPKADEAKAVPLSASDDGGVGGGGGYGEDEPTCLELRLMWRASQRQNRLAQSNSLPMAFDPFAFSAWDEYIKPRYIDRPKSMMFERTIPDRYRVYRRLRPFEKIARLTTTTTRAIMENQLPPRKTNLFRLGFPITKIPVISMRLTAKDRFEELKEIMRHEKAKHYRATDDDGDGDEDGDGETFSVVPVAMSTSNDTGKKRPGYETLMSRPRHFSQGHYMNVKPSGADDADDNLAATVLPQYKSSPLINSWNSRW